MFGYNNWGIIRNTKKNIMQIALAVLPLSSCEIAPEIYEIPKNNVQLFLMIMHSGCLKNQLQHAFVPQFVRCNDIVCTNPQKMSSSYS